MTIANRTTTRTGGLRSAATAIAIVAILALTPTAIGAALLTLGGVF